VAVNAEPSHVTLVPFAEVVMLTDDDWAHVHFFFRFFPFFDFPLRAWALEILAAFSFE
jgi:hypothetical protein